MPTGTPEDLLFFSVYAMFEGKTIGKNLFHFNEIIYHRNEIVNTIFHFDEMFWDVFYKLCENNREKPAQVAKKINIPVGSLTAWKKGTEPNTKALKKIADYFNTTIDYLLERKNTHEEKDPREIDLITKYRISDEKGKERICYTAETEAERTKNEIRKGTN